jgi:hypothetical protein
MIVWKPGRDSTTQRQKWLLTIIGFLFFTFSAVMLLKFPLVRDADVIWGFNALVALAVWIWGVNSLIKPE